MYHPAPQPSGLADPGCIILRSSHVLYFTPTISTSGRPHEPTREASSRGRPISIQRQVCPHEHTVWSGKQIPVLDLPASHDPHVYTTAPSNQKLIVPRPTRPYTTTYLPGRSWRPNEELSSHDRPNRTDSRTQPVSRPIPTTHRPNDPVDPKLFLKPVSHDISACLNLMPPTNT